MNLQDIQPAIAAIQNNPVVSDLRSHTYLSTYPDIINFAKAYTPNNARQFRQLALLVYGWMPRVLRIDPAHSQQAIAAITAASNANISNYQNIAIQDIANCLHSLVGASKLLHFINPNVFPIWDSKIQAFRNLPNGNYDMANIQNYHAYVDDVHNIIADQNFNAYYAAFVGVFNNRLEQSNINQYQVGAIRAVEVSAFELAP